jgi:hypothetical protein
MTVLAQFKKYSGLVGEIVLYFHLHTVEDGKNLYSHDVLSRAGTTTILARAGSDSGRLSTRPTADQDVAASKVWRSGATVCRPYYG